MSTHSESETTVASLADRLLDRVGAAARPVALLAASLATAGSLFFSEVLGWIPCELCWYQRIAMYPIALLFLIGTWRDDRRVSLYVLPLALIGFAISLYHYLMVMLIIPPAACSGSVPCSVDYINISGALSFIKVPFLALVAFIVILFGAIIDLGRQEADDNQRSARLISSVIVAGAVLLYLAAGALI